VQPDVWTTKERVEKLRHMHRNPVKRGLVESPEQWRWSSYRYYLLEDAGPVRVNQGWTEIRFEFGRRSFAAAGIPIPALAKKQGRGTLQYWLRTTDQKPRPPRPVFPKLEANLLVRFVD
jgi:hypothetical protein